MTIRNIDKETFGQLLKLHVRPSDPIDSFEYLVGRSRQRDSIEEALTLSGRHIFIYGDRGAGKTSLAHTVAFEHNPATNSPVIVGCGTQTTFASIVKDIASQLIGRSRLTGRETTESASISAQGIGAATSNKQSERPLEGIDLNAATGLLIEAAGTRAGRTVVVIDEFENLPDVADRHAFAELVKQLSDRRAPLALIFCGIGSSLDDLLKGHNSAHRYIQEVKLPTPPLNFGESWEIIDTAAAALGLKVNDDSRVRIAQVSDGFPHYVHLTCEKLFWIAFRSEERIELLTSDHYMEAVRNALEGVEARLRKIYDVAVKKEDDEYQQILWAAADHFELERNNKSIYANSYERIMAEMDLEPLSMQKFSRHLASFASETHGCVLRSDRPGWVRFSENLVRGYVRLVAESRGIRLAMEHEPSPDPKFLLRPTYPKGKDPRFQFPRYNWKGKR